MAVPYKKCNKFLTEGKGQNKYFRKIILFYCSKTMERNNHCLDIKYKRIYRINLLVT